jgi:hypothetical protein
MPIINRKHKDEAFGEEAQDLLEDALKGKTIRAFGPEGNGIWGSNPEVMEFTVSNVHVPYADAKSHFVSLDVYLAGYDADKTGLIYTDEVFLASIQEAIKRAGLNGNAVGYSEQGLQHSNAVNLDVKYGDLTNIG